MEMYSGRANSGPGIQDYHYERLKDTQNGIRLARIKPGAGSRRIAIDLVEAWLPKSGQRSHEEYDALSYTWGNGERTKTILCNGRPLAITMNLLEALHRFRDSVHYVTLWIDQICIWQDSLAERNSQVSRMSQIFTSARKVVVWLGDHYDDSQAGMQLADQLRILCITNRGKTDASLLETPGLPRRGDKKWKALAAILHRPWFWRTWIVQEIVLNPVVELVLGGNTLLWSDLEAIVATLDGPASVHAYHDPTTNAWELPFSRINRIRQRHQQLKSSDLGFDNAKARHWDCGEPDDMELLDLLLMSRDLGATDPRDKVYALLGLSNHELQPDYECSAEHIFTEFAMHTIGEATGLATLTSHGLRIHSRTKAAQQALILLSCSGYHNRSLVLQSWVPDWTADLRSRPLMFDPRFRAGGGELELDWSFETGLQLCGKLLDTIGTAGSVRLEDTTTSDARAAIESWWAEARRIANATVMQSPGSTTRMNAFRGLQRDLGLCRHGYYEGEKILSDGTTGPRKPRRKRSLINEHDLAEDLNDPHDARLTMTLGPTRGRVFFSTTNGYIGLEPSTVLEGDLVYVVLGGSVPYIFRPREDGALTLIGEAYVQGIMNGEALMMDRLNMPHEIHVR